jgi:serine/threonine protein kinase
MGQCSSQELRAPENLRNNYSYVKNLTDVRYREGKIMQDRQKGMPVFQKDVYYYSVDDFRKFKDSLRTTFEHPNLVKFYGYESAPQEFYCAYLCTVSYFVEIYENDLAMEIQARNEKKKYFTEGELLDILESVASAGAFLETRQCLVGNIRPSQLWITPSNEYKIVDKGIFGTQMTDLQVTCYDKEAKHHYWAPEVYKIFRSDSKVKNSSYKADVFTFGMTLLEAGNLESGLTCYKWEDEFKFDEERLQILIAKFSERYSKKTVELIQRMLSTNPEVRPTFAEIDAAKRGQTVPKKRVEQVKSHGANITPKKEVVVETKMLLDPTLDERIRASVQQTEMTLERCSPGKYKRVDYDEILPNYLKNPNFHQDLQSAIEALSPAVTNYSIPSPPLGVNAVASAQSYTNK